MSKKYTPKDIGRAIQMARTLGGFRSRQAYGDHRGVTRVTVHRWESGDQLPNVIDFLNMLSETGVEMSVFFRDSAKTK